MTTGGETLRYWRHEVRKWSQPQLAERISGRIGRTLGRQTISNWETGQLDPDFFQARAADDLLGARGAILDAYGMVRNVPPEGDGITLAAIEARLLAVERALGRTTAPAAGEPAAPPAPPRPAPTGRRSREQ